VFVVYETTFFNLLIGFILNPEMAADYSPFAKKIKKFAAGK